MKFLLPLSTALLVVPVVSSWTLLTPRWFGPSLLDTSLGPVMQRHDDLMNRAFSQTSPRYEFHNSENEVKIQMDVPGVKAEDLTVTVEDDGNALHIAGHRELEKEGYSYSSKFSQSFSLDAATQVDKFTANLDNGVLTITAPKDMKRLEASVRKIPVIQSAEDTTKTLKEAEPVEAHVKPEVEAAT